MDIDISKIKFEEAYDNTPFEEYTLYFIVNYYNVDSACIILEALGYIMKGENND